MPATGSIQYKKADLSFSRRGTGNRILLVFHGFGQNKYQLLDQLEVLENDFTIYSFDLFFHGESFWPYGDKPLVKPFWQSLMLKFLEKEGIAHFDLLGFSMGGKFALALLEFVPSKIVNLFLVAPDGIKTGFWYRMATFPIGLRHLFKFMTHNPAYLFQFTQLLGNYGLMDQSLVKFSESQLMTVEERKRVYYSWVVFRRFRFNIYELKQLIKKAGVRVYLFVGTKDKIIPPRAFNRFLSVVPIFQHHVFESGHGQLLQHTINHLQRSKSSFISEFKNSTSESF